MESLYVDFFTGTFYAMRHKYKKKYKLLLEDQASYFFESLMLMSIQIILCFFILTTSDYSTISYINDWGLNLCMFFTNLCLHFSCILTIRNGLIMCKFVVYHSEEFGSPVAAFMMGLLLMCVNLLCAVTNMLESLKLDSVVKIISKFVAFKLLIQIQDFYTK